MFQTPEPIYPKDHPILNVVAVVVSLALVAANVTLLVAALTIESWWKV